MNGPADRKTRVATLSDNRRTGLEGFSLRWFALGVVLGALAAALLTAAAAPAVRSPKPQARLPLSLPSPFGPVSHPFGTGPELSQAGATRR